MVENVCLCGVALMWQGCDIVSAHLPTKVDIWLNSPNIYGVKVWSRHEMLRLIHAHWLMDKRHSCNPLSALWQGINYKLVKSMDVAPYCGNWRQCFHQFHIGTQSRVTYQIPKLQFQRIRCSHVALEIHFWDPISNRRYHCNMNIKDHSKCF